MLALTTYQRTALACEARLTWNCWARQTGKSFTFSLRRLLRGLRRRRTQVILSAGERQSREVMDKLRRHCRALRIWYEWHGHGCFRGTSFRQLEIRLAGGLRIIGLPANPMTARGYTGDVFLDEFAMHRNDDAIWAALYPTILRGDGELDIASTPRGQQNLFHRLRDHAAFTATTLPLAAAVAQGLKVDLQAARDGIADDWTWRQEFECEFLDEATSFMTSELIRSCQDAQLSGEIDHAALKRRGAELYAGIDVGRRHDRTVVWLWERDGSAHVTRGLVVLQGESFTRQEETIARLLAHPSLRRCCIDATGMGMPLAERLTERFGEHRVEPITFTAAIKCELAGRLRMFAERGQLSIPVDEEIADDWHALTRVVTAAGHVRLDAERSADGHADRFWAAALGIHAARSPTGEIGFVSGGRLSFARSGAW